MINVKTIRAEIPKSKDVEVKLLARKVLNTLEELKLFNPILFTNWFEQANSKNKAAFRPVKFSLEFIESIIEREWDKKFPELGSMFTFWDETDNIEKTISFSIGKTVQNFNIVNNFSLTFPYRYNFNESELNNIKNLVIKIWNVKEFEIW